ncbi:hypothetical protein D6779_10020 [Candidatus Parcubacteria bacterium]|nr:MAG: hypothetical protein D6779_10020 [Candidatus Parcubacteria bacterium]
MWRRVGVALLGVLGIFWLLSLAIVMLLVNRWDASSLIIWAFMALPGAFLLYQRQKLLASGNRSHGLALAGDNDEDAWDAWFFDEPDQSDVHGKLKIHYVDAEGRHTKRTIELKKASPNYLLAYCRMRKADRCFRIDRVKHAIDLETGEIVDDLHEWLSRKTENV